MSQHLHAEHAAWNGATGFKHISCLILVIVIASYMRCFIQMLFIALGIADYYSVPTLFNLSITTRTEVFAFRQCKILIKFNVIGDFWTARVQYKDNKFSFIAKPSTFPNSSPPSSNSPQTTQVDNRSPFCSCLDHNNMWQTSC